MRRALICTLLSVPVSSELADPALIIDPITEERASRTLYRIELLRRIREQVLPSPLLTERLKLCQPSPDLPEWWECGRHDHHLLLGASKHGVSRTDYHILNDPTLSFLEAHQRFTTQRGGSIPAGGQGETQRAAEGAGTPLLSPAELACAAAATTAATKDEDGDKEEAKTEEDASEVEVKMETEDVPHPKSATPEEDQGEAEEGSSGTAGGSPAGAGTLEPGQEPDGEAAEAPEHPDVAVAAAEEEEVAPKLPEQPSPKEQPNPEERDPPDSPKSPKSADTAKSPEEEDEERTEEDDKSEKSSQAEGEHAQAAFPPVGASQRMSVCLLRLHPAGAEQKNFDEESIASVSTSAQNETRDGFCPDDLPDASALQVLQERACGFSFWPKVSVRAEAEPRSRAPPSLTQRVPQDRVMINRMDNICEAVIKGKWPVNRRYLFDFPGNLLPGHASAGTPGAAAAVAAGDNPLQRRSQAELVMAGINTLYSASEDKTLSPQLHVSP